MTTNLPNIIARAYNRPLLMEPNTAATFFAVLSKRIGASQLHTLDESLSAEAMQEKADAYQPKPRAHILGESQYFDDDRPRDYAVVDHIAVINVMGTLVNRSSFLGSLSGIVGYNQLLNQARAADADPEVDGIFFHADSGGGEVSGCFDTVDAIAALNKPTAWFNDELTASAAFALACGADHIYTPRTGQLGSIGVLVAHENHAKAIAEEGVEVTLIHSGAHKVDGNPYQALSPEVLANIQSDLDDARQLFAETVANYRPMNVAQVLATEARVYNGAQAVDLGLADYVMSRDAAFAHFSASLLTKQSPLSGTDSTNPHGVTMSSENQVRAEHSPAPASQQALDAAAYSSAEVQAAIDTATVVASEREAARIFAVLESPAAEGRMTTALALAKSGMNAEAAAGVLATIPVSTADSRHHVPSANAEALARMSHADIVEPETEAVATAPKPRKMYLA